MKRHLKRKLPQPLACKGYCCGSCNKVFQYEMALHHHEERYGKERAKPFKCSLCEKCFSRKATLQHHQQHVHRIGGDMISEEAVKRKAEEDQSPSLPKKIKGIPEADKVVSSMKGAKVDAFFLIQKQKIKRKTSKCFSRKGSQTHLKKTLKEKKALKWNLVYHCTLSIPDKYKDHPLRYSPHFRTPHPLTTTYRQQVLQQLNASLEILEDGMSIFAQPASGWTLEENHALTWKWSIISL